MAVLGLRFCARAFSSCGKQGPLFIAVRGPLTIAASLVGSTGSRRAGSVVVAHGPSHSAACGIFPDQGSNPCPLHWQADSQPLRHQGRPPKILLLICFSLFVNQAEYLLCKDDLYFFFCKQDGNKYFSMKYLIFFFVSRNSLYIRKINPLPVI